MTLELDSNVVYAILATIVFIVLVTNITKILRMRMKPKPYPIPYDQESTQVQWPQQNQ
jgi:hypothetical protein